MATKLLNFLQTGIKENSNIKCGKQENKETEIKILEKTKWAIDYIKKVLSKKKNLINSKNKKKNKKYRKQKNLFAANIS